MNNDQNTVAGFSLDDVLKNEEARIAHEQQELERKRKALEEARKRKEGKDVKPATKILTPAARVQPATYHDLIWEPRAYREQDQTNKALLTYDKSLERLRKAGFDRHARPPEESFILIDHLEGRLPSNLETIAQDMLASYGEWLSAAVQRKGDSLIVSTDPQNLRWKKNKYIIDGKSLQCASQQEFNIKGLPSNKYIDLKDVPEDLATFLYARPFDQLPPAMQTGDKRAQLYLPPEGIIRPVGRYGFNVRFIIGFYDDGASRGVRRASAASAA